MICRKNSLCTLRMINLFYKKYCCIVWTNHPDAYPSALGAPRPGLTFILLNTDEILFVQFSAQPWTTRGPYKPKMSHV